MNKLQTALKEIAYLSKKFPQEAFDVITVNREEAIPYLRSAIEKALEEKDELENNYQLHFYAFYLLGEFKDREFFPKLMEFVSLPGDILDYLIGDGVTSGLKDILYNTYNGDLELLKNTIMNEAVDEFVRSGLLDVMGQLYLDGVLTEKEWREFIKQNVYIGEECNYFYTGLATAICRCHFVDMLPEIRYMLHNGLMDEMSLGRYDSIVDYMFEYRDDEKNFCDSSIKAADMLKNWAMFEDDLKPQNSKSNKNSVKKIINEMCNEFKPEPLRKIGRNDICPCGSGKKYKFCCLNKPKAVIDSIERPEERMKWLKEYPYLGNNKLADRVYLEDYFDSESIELDKYLYLGIKHRPILIWLRDEQQEQKRCREYLCLAFPMFMEKVKKEGIKTFEEYDRKFSIHYFCEEWIGKLLNLLEKDGSNSALYAEVKKCYGEMQKR